ncbi:GntR family transcriptional regulator [Desulforhopalus singaporensis]|uniref:DNA-binding transcriptional regulator, GntR family n=1 Tax=Desulforhopalus singaporensis TaxID=91360 RepID=A0A1H0S528_9BACT|nr:GntR family transcriptional regulator [Desulforhopalus singaporensis]SDP36368.1 DNA-binding transcriptional regulator, GntR family [Desulforhopalus singaporensis]
MGQPKKKNSEDAVYNKLKTAIRKRYIKQGSQLVEINLAQKLGVSRTPVRGAIKRLEAEGLVNSIPNRGAFVITPTKKEIEETFLVRAQLECMAVEIVAENCTEQQLAELRRLADSERKVFEKNMIDEYYTANDDLHLKIAEFSGNAVLCAYIKELLDRTRIYLILYDPFYKIEYSPTSEHHEILEAIATRDQQRARTAVRNHINNSIDGLHSAGQLPDDYISV